jgi:L-asparaginase
MKNILVLTTGGTIEKSYSEEEGSLENRESLLKNKLLNKLRLPGVDVSVKTIMAKDSLIMTDSDREMIFKNINESILKYHGILVLHGTDTMDKTIEHCIHQLPSPQIPIVFTGAMKPAGFDDSDAFQNFTEALMVCQIAKPNFYLSFHGQLFYGNHIKKNKEKRTFEGTRVSF